MIESQCHFAVKSGGNAVHRDFSSADGGITIDLRRIDHVRVSEDKETVELGPGSKWKEVYENLEGDGLTVSGARDGEVGVGGFLTNGKSFFYSLIFHFYFTFSID